MIHLQKTSNHEFSELLNTPFDELTCEEWEQLKESSKQLQYPLEQACINDNFGYYNRVGAITRGNEFLLQERRRVASGELVMVCCDIARMGRRNSEIGEVAVNNAIALSLKEIRSWHGVNFLSQLNSGDEFVFIVDQVDGDGIISWMNGVFKEYGFDGIYAPFTDIRADYIQSANTGVERVYELKKKCRYQIHLLLIIAADSAASPAPQLPYSQSSQQDY